MALIEFKNLPDTSTPLNAENLNNNFSELEALINTKTITKLLSSKTTTGSYTISSIEDYDLIVVVGANGNSQKWGTNTMIIPVDAIKNVSGYGSLSQRSYTLEVRATSTVSSLNFAFTNATTFDLSLVGDRTGLLGLYGIKL